MSPGAADRWLVMWGAPRGEELPRHLVVERAALPWREKAPAGFPAGFEGPDAVEAEDRRRIDILRQVVKPGTRALADRLQALDFNEVEPTTLASSRFMRVARMRIAKVAQPLLEERLQNGGLFKYSIVPRQWFVPEKGVPTYNPKEHLAQFRAILAREGIYSTSGVVIGSLDCSYVRQVSSMRLGFQFHLHMICDAKARPVFERLRRLPRLRTGDDVERPVVFRRITPLTELSALTYCFKSYWRCRTIDPHPVGEDLMQRAHDSSLPNEAACREWIWRDRNTLAGTSLVIGTRDLRHAFRHRWR